MHPFTQTFMALLLAHLLGDFPLQTGSMVHGKVALRAASYLRHGLIHLVLAILAVALFAPLPLWQTAAVAALALLVPGHLLLDLGKSLIVRRYPHRDGALLYLADQLLHILIVAAAAAVAVQALPPAMPLLNAWVAHHETILLYLVVITATVFPAGYLIRYLLAPLSRQLAASRHESAPVEGLSNAGLYLGWLERALLVIAFGNGSLTAVGLIIGAKSIARFPQFKSRAFAEYFLIGTLCSVAIAAVGGWVLLTWGGAGASH
ncbi:MAG: DUF3307 domain-containing protein [Woeseia sp.]